MSSTPRKPLLLAVALLVAALAWYLSRPDDATWQRLQRGGPLVVAMDLSFPPFDTLDAAGRPAGFDVDLAHELGRRLGAPVEIKAIAFDGLVDAVLAGKADAVISAFPLDPRLTQDVRYSRPYFEAGLVLLSQEESAGPTPTDLADRIVAVEWGSLGDAWARTQGLQVRRYETPAEAMQAAAAGEVSEAVVDAVTAALAAPPGLHMHTPPLTSDPYVIVLPLRATRLAAAIDLALADMLADGAWQRLTRAYFTLDPPPPP